MAKTKKGRQLESILKSPTTSPQIEELPSEEEQELSPPTSPIASPNKRVTISDPNDKSSIATTNLTSDESTEIMAALTQTNKAMQQILERLQTQETSTSTTPVNKPAPSTTRPVFLLTPLRDGIDEIVDLSTKSGAKYWDRATKSLYDGPKYDVNTETFSIFIDLLNNRVSDLGMLEPDSNLHMLSSDRHKTGPINPIKQYGRITYDEMYEWERSFINDQTRKAQNSKILYDLLMNSLSVTGLQRIQAWRHNYIVHGREAGGCLFKIIVQESYVDSLATTNTIRLHLTNLDKWIKTNGSDVTKFNAYVNTQMATLKAHGETSTDCLVNIFKAYSSIKDKDFNAYIRNIQHQHEDGTNLISVTMLMLRADAFYKTAITRETWEQPSVQDKRVHALTTKIQNLEKKDKEKKGRDRSQSPSSRKRRDSNKDTDTPKESKPNWLAKHIKPKKQDMTKTKEWKNTQWHWCSPDTGGKCKGNWRVHTPAECKGLANKDKEKDKTKNEDKPEGDKKRKGSNLNIVTANQALVKKSKVTFEETSSSSDDNNSTY